MSTKREMAFRGGVAASAVDGLGARCCICHNATQQTAFLISADEFANGSYCVPRGFVCNECAGTSDEALQLFTEQECAYMRGFVHDKVRKILT